MSDQKTRRQFIYESVIAREYLFWCRQAEHYESALRQNHWFRNRDAIKTDLSEAYANCVGFASVTTSATARTVPTRVTPDPQP